jgi:hypothetical protein
MKKTALQWFMQRNKKYSLSYFLQPTLNASL